MKKIILLLFLCVLSLPTFAYATSTEGDSHNISDFEITSPKEEMTILPNTAIVITGMGVDNDVLEIDVYSVRRTLSKGKEIVIKKLNNSYSLTIDALKVFAQEIELKEGENLITINITRDGVLYSIDRIVNCNKNMNFNTIIRQLDY